MSIGPVNRRTFLKASAALGAAGAFAMPGIARAKSGSMTFFSYSTYTDPVLTADFTPSSGVELNIQNFGNLDQMVGRLKAGGGSGIDVVSVPNQLTHQLFEDGLLEPVDTSRIERWNDLFPEFRDAEFVASGEAGKVLAVPTVWGPEGLLYRTDKIESADSWAALWDPAYRGRISPVDYSYEMVLMAAQLLGYGDALAQEPIAFTDEQYAAIKQKLLEQKPLVTKYFTSAAEGASLIAGGEAWISVGRLSMLKPIREEGVPIAMVAPKEGAHGWCTSTALVADSQNKDQAYAFLNYVVGETYQTRLMTEKNYPVANKAIMDSQPKELTDTLMLSDPNLLGNMLWWKRAADIQRINELWAEVKAA